jgi:hypothetical protein
MYHTIPIAILNDTRNTLLNQLILAETGTVFWMALVQMNCKSLFGQPWDNLDVDTDTSTEAEKHSYLLLDERLTLGNLRRVLEECSSLIQIM